MQPCTVMELRPVCAFIIAIPRMRERGIHLSPNMRGYFAASLTSTATFFKPFWDHF